MKTKIYPFILLCAATLLAFNVNAQCGARYKDMVFSNVTVTSNITYSTANSTTLKLDVYEPTGDTAAQRPLIILAHGGSFISGDKTNDNVVTQLCTNFAKRGYVTASIDYRLGNAIQMYLDSQYAITTVLKALSDGKSAIRFFRKDAATTNTYRINPNIIFAGGNSAGAVLYMHSIYVDSVGELTPLLQSIINANGGFEGNSGNDGYSSELQGLSNGAGGLNNPYFIGPNSKPSANFQGDQDATVPYNCAYAVNASIQVRLCGLGAAEPLYQQYGVNHVSIVYPGEGHVPWQSNQTMFTEVDTTTANFLYNLQCTGSVGVNEVSLDKDILIYPNPTSSVINISVPQIAAYKSVQLFDETGKMIEEKFVSTNTITFDKNSLSSGLYLIRILKHDATTVVRKVVVQ